MTNEETTVIVISTFIIIVCTMVSAMILGEDS